jgi:hypothetical protein
MSHYFENNIVEIKREYTEYLLSVLIPLIFEGIRTIYDNSIEIDKERNIRARSDSSIKPLGVTIIFQNFLKNIPNLTNQKIEDETKRIRDHSECADIFDDLIKAVIKSNIILLTYNASGKTCKLVTEKLHTKIEPKTFIHKCYIEVARLIFNVPELFEEKHKRNQQIIYQLIREGINKAIRNILPLKQILQEYLSKDYIDLPNAINERVTEKPTYEKIKTELKDDIKEDSIKKDNIKETNIKMDDEIIKSLTPENEKIETNKPKQFDAKDMIQNDQEDKHEDKIDKDITKLENSMNELNSLIYDRKKGKDDEVKDKKNFFEELYEN